MVESVVSPGQVRVFFVDYGDKEVVPTAALKAVDPEYLELPVQFVLCRLAGVCPMGGASSWDEASCSRIGELCSGSEVEDK